MNELVSGRDPALVTVVFSGIAKEKESDACLSSKAPILQDAKMMENKTPISTNRFIVYLHFLSSLTLSQDIFFTTNYPC
jgi:hypothetical protein